MDLTSEVALTAVVVVIGEWAKAGKWPNVKFIVGSGFYLLFITAIGSGQPEIAQKLAAVVLVTVILVYFQDIAKKLGFTK